MRRGLLWVAAAYIAALATALLVGTALAGRHPLVIVVAADAAATCALFVFSYATRNSSLYDPYWAWQTVPIAAYLGLVGAGAADPVRQVVVIALVCAYAARFAHRFFSHFTGLEKQDWRYLRMKERSGRAFWLVSFAGIHMAPTGMVLVGCLPLYFALAAPGRPFGLLDVVAAIVTASGIVIEAIADAQLARFTAENRDKSRFLKSGLWAYSRHPNYFGEVTFWLGLYLFAVAADPTGSWWSAAGFVTMAGLFLFASIPMMDRRMREKRPDYAEHERRVSRFIPWFPRKG